MNSSDGDSGPASRFNPSGPTSLSSSLMLSVKAENMGSPKRSVVAQLEVRSGRGLEPRRRFFSDWRSLIDGLGEVHGPF